MSANSLDVTRLYLRDPPAPADLGLVFGHSDPATSERRARHAAGLYAAGFVPRLLVTGGVTSPGGRSEAEWMAAVAVSARVSPDHILVEPLARTTAENITRSAELLRERDLLAGLSTVVLVSCGYHMGRVKLLAQSAFPTTVRFLACPHPHGPSENDWYRSADGRACVVNELALFNELAERVAGRCDES